jgi:predicted HTH domain antitoxin
MAKQLVVEVPDSVQVDVMELRMILAARLYEQGRMALGHAAKLAGLTKRLFMERLADYGVSVFNYPASELENDLKNA